MATLQCTTFDPLGDIFWPARNILKFLSPSDVDHSATEWGQTGDMSMLTGIRLVIDKVTALSFWLERGEVDILWLAVRTDSLARLAELEETSWS